ncbi:MAG: hypothetical protein ACREBQ_01460 [Nitrososphaerales archaeon]
MMKIPLPRTRGRDLESYPWCYLLWGAPAAVEIATSAAYNVYALSTTFAGILWTFSVAWIGIGCFMNARYCGRVHCMIDGILFPLLAFVGVLNVLSIVSFSWNLFSGIFLAILIMSFVPELAWRKYARAEESERATDVPQVPQSPVITESAASQGPLGSPNAVTNSDQRKITRADCCWGELC